MSENKYLRTIVKALDDKKGNDIRVIRISEISSMCDYLVIADGSNRNQVQAMCNNVEHAMREAGAEMKNREGYAYVDKSVSISVAIRQTQIITICFVTGA